MTRTRQKSCWVGKPVIVARDSLTVWLDVIVPKLLELEIWMRYVAALAASLQSNATGCATVAPSVGLSRLGVPGLAEPPARTVRLTDRLVARGRR